MIQMKVIEMKKIKKRCNKCNKKLKLLDENLCKCNYYYCSKHRLCHSHNCEYDMKTENKKRIELENMKVVSDKVENI